MIVYPALDILDGQVVRLIRGDFEQKTVFPLDPVVAAQDFAAAGAKYLHLVDLSGARDPKARQLKTISEMIVRGGLKVQVGGGIRSIAEIEELLKLGADRVVLGSLVVTQPDLATEILQRFVGEHITFALDVQIQDSRAMVMSHGWTKSSGLDFVEVVEPFLAHGLKRVLCTDIDVDGRMVGPNLELYDILLSLFPDLELQASGGVAEANDLKRLHQAGVHSAVVGRALLSGQFTLQEALSHAQ